MLKKLSIVGFFGLTLVLASCGEGDSKPNSICDCIELQIDIMGETENLAFDDPAMQDIEEKYKAELERCEEIAMQYEEDFEGLEGKELEAKQLEILNACPAYKELEAIMERQMQEMRESMGNMNLDDLDLNDLGLDDMDLEELMGPED